jgi:hypothetical protein
LIFLKKLIFFMTIVLCLIAVSSLLAVDVKEDGTSVIITTTGYEVHWKKAAQMGYHQAFVAGSKDTIIGTAGRAFYHSGQYGGNWYDWGGMSEWKLVSKGGGKAVVDFTSKDGTSKQFTCRATYYDSAPYIKHELTVTALADVTSFESGHSPMFEVNVDMKGMKAINQPYPHGYYWTDTAYGALYGPDAQSADLSLWGTRDPGRMQLNHDNQKKNLKKGETQTITYYLAFGKGGEKEAEALTAKVTNDPGSGKAVSPEGSLSTTWGEIRSGR